MKIVLTILLAAAMGWYMWTKGISVVQSKMAVAFVGRRGANHWGASMTAATGWIKRVLPLKEGAKYRLTCDMALTEGAIVVEILHNKQVVATFDGKKHTATLPAQKGRYIIGTKFKKASGEYTLTWEKI